MDSSSPFGAKRLEDMITCPLCAEVFTHARALPCLHTLCLQCVEQHCHSSDTGRRCSSAQRWHFDYCKVQA